MKERVGRKREPKRGGRVFTWEKNVGEMNGKGTCPRLHVKKKKKEEKGSSMDGI